MATTNIPVIEDMNGYYRISIYTSNSDGTFSRSAKRPFRAYAGLISSITSPVGIIESSPRSKQRISWKTPTVTHYESRRPQSVYQFFRESLKARKYYIASAKDGLTRARALYLHEIHFRGGSAGGLRKLFADKFIDSMQIYGISKKA